MSDELLPSNMQITEQPFGQLSDGRMAKLFTLTNANGLQVKLTDYGAIVVSLFTPDKTGRMADIVLGYDRVADYESDTYYLGAVVGRYAGRIDQGLITLDGKTYKLTLNAPDSQLHGGPNAFNKKLWQSTINRAQNKVAFNYLSEDGENGFPGNLEITVSYQLNDDNELIVEYYAKTDKTTLFNVTQHSYFNLAGHNAGSVIDHQVSINAEHFLPMDERAYPTGEIKPVQGTLHDFREFRRLADNIDNTDDEQIRIGLGFDNYWLTTAEAISGNAPAAKAHEPHSGRTLTIYSDQPSMILYTANYIDGSHVGKNNTCYQQRGALCLEPQRANNLAQGATINNTILTPEQPFTSTIKYCFN